MPKSINRIKRVNYNNIKQLKKGMKNKIINIQFNIYKEYILI